jgi:Zn-dependent peptidase ImmA (M78 family)
MITFDRLKVVLQKVRNIQEHQKLMCLDGDRIPVSIEDLQYVVKDMYGFTKIEKFDVAFAAEFTRGMLERYADKTAKIYIRKDQSDDWKRYIAAKELCHLVIDEPEDFSPDGHSTIQHLIATKIPTKNNGNEKSNDVDSEWLAEFAAREILYPYPMRKNDIELLKSNKQTQTSLALHYEIPEYAIGVVLQEHYMTGVSAVWEELPK